MRKNPFVWLGWLKLPPGAHGAFARAQNEVEARAAPRALQSQKQNHLSRIFGIHGMARLGKKVGLSACPPGIMAAASEETPLLAKKPDGEAVQ